MNVPSSCGTQRLNFVTRLSTLQSLRSAESNFQPKIQSQKSHAAPQTWQVRAMRKSSEKTTGASGIPPSKIRRSVYFMHIWTKNSNNWPNRRVSREIAANSKVDTIHPEKSGLDFRPSQKQVDKAKEGNVRRTKGWPHCRTCCSISDSSSFIFVLIRVARSQFGQQDTSIESKPSNEWKEEKKAKQK
jgi:hypothetical protein